ncbi:hypothetical protein [Taibaiella chishuiensis]|uniref:PRTRC genetic system protein F n=1 Tax=Taibaiella chishuiensis TaxID=1434707 RepID=A0A2P8D0V2_9BACT|nr:hypothetical protein [Taibaiella chishuiensis]PSK90852.1 hypothetical protein B0I18_107264 [Taibaiella chishuiensis]
METLQSVRPLRRSTKRPEKCKRNKARTATERTNLFVADALLKTQFLPIVKDSGQLENFQQKEKDFFSSFHNITTFYKIPKANFKSVAYPYNVALAHQHVNTCLSQLRCHDQVIIVATDANPCCLATVKSYNTNRTLYYIPLSPLVDLQRNPAKHQQYNLLLSVYAYLFQVVRLPSYQSDDYMSGCHEMLKEWVVSDPDEWEDDSFENAMSEFKMAEYFGERLRKQMKHPYHLAKMKERIESIIPRSEWDLELVNVAESAHLLYVDFPKRTFYENIVPDLFSYDEDNVTCADQYLSFIWSAKGWLYDQVVEYVNSATQEDNYLEEPMLVSLFNSKTPTVSDNLEFEKRLFDLLGDIIDLTYLFKP